MKTPKTILVEPHDMEVAPTADGKFTITFRESRGDALLTIKVSFQDWWLRILAEQVGKVVAHRIKEAAKLKANVESAYHDEMKS